MRPIDADKVLEVLRELDTHSFSGTMHIKNFMHLINEQPTVYDVNKVLKQLEEEKSMVPVNRVLDDITKDKPKELGQLIAYDKAINIVKAGGNINE